MIDPSRIASDPLLQLRDVHAPPPPQFWPPAPGWWLLAALAIASALLLGRYAYRRYRLRRQRQRIIGALLDLEQGFEHAKAPDFVAQVSVLLRRVALSRFPRARVASLSGQEWLRFLDETGGGGRFSCAPGKVLASGPYQPHAEVDARALVELARDWIEHSL